VKRTAGRPAFERGIVIAATSIAIDAKTMRIFGGPSFLDGAGKFAARGIAIVDFTLPRIDDADEGPRRGIVAYDVVVGAWRPMV